MLLADVYKRQDLDNTHSIYVDQWDWEKIIKKEERNPETLKSFVKDIFTVLKETECYIFKHYPQVGKILPKDIYFITSQELELSLIHI